MLKGTGGSLRLALVLLALGLSACATKPVPLELEQPDLRGYQLPLDLERLQLTPIVLEDPHLRIIDIQDPRIAVSQDALALCDERKAWLPSKGAITQTTWQFANRRNEGTIDRCAQKHARLVEQVKALLGYIREIAK